MDVIALTRLGFPIGVATSGTSLTEDHIKILKRYTDNLYFLFDNDKAGQQATFRAMKLCYNQDLFPKIINLPETVKDVDDVANLEDGKQLFQSYLDNSQDGFLVLFERMRTHSDMTSPIDKQKLINAMFELIISVGNITIQEHYKVLLAEKLGFAPEIISVQFQKYKNGEGKILIRQQERQEEYAKPTLYQPSRELLFASLFYQEFLGKILKEEEFSQALTSFAMQIAIAIPESYVARVFKGELNAQEVTEVEELQLWWEKEVSDI
jgi:DNA primase